MQSHYKIGKNAFMRHAIAFLMATAILVLIAAGTRTPVAASYNPLSHCGTERWHIKTLDDAGVNHIVQVAKSSSVAEMRSLAVTSNYVPNDDTNRYSPTEFDKFSFQAQLMGFKEETDRDLHLVIADPHDSSVTMIAEVPDPQCSTMHASGHADQIARVRTSLINCFGQPPKNNRFKKFTHPMLVQIMGIGFFDRLHGQTGVAPNGIELHPAMSVKTVSGQCPTGFQQTAARS